MNLAIFERNREQAQKVKDYLEEHTKFDICFSVDDAKEGVELLKQHRPDIVLSSMVLKSGDGFYVLDEIKKSELKSKIIIMGDFTTGDIINKAMEKGATYYLTKPFEMEILTARIFELMTDGKPQTNEVKSERKRTSSVEEKVSNIFISIGIPPHIKGYAYLREGIRLAVEEPSIINNVTKELYPKIGEAFSTSASKVERAIRHAIEVAWNRGKVDAINSIFGVRVYIGTDRPTNSEFIALIADKLILEEMV